MTEDEFKKVVELFQILRCWRDQGKKDSSLEEFGEDAILGEPESSESAFCPEPPADFGENNAHRLKSDF